MKKRIIGVVRSQQSFYPESRAYQAYFNEHPNFSVVEFGSLEEADANSDLIIFYAGFLPFWVRLKSKLIMEYHSSSTGKSARFKNVLKRVLNKRANGYVFLNKKVKNQFFFFGMSKEKFVFRSMGFDASLVAAMKPCSSSFDHDIVYMGSLQRSGLEETLIKIASMGYRIAVIGNSEHEASLFKRNDNIECFGRLTQQESFAIATRCRFGLNYTPDEYPFYFQDSTKLIEYCGLGLKVITNRYDWVDQFEESSGFSFMDVKDLIAGENPYDFKFKTGDVSHLSWANVINESGLERLISDSLL